MSKRIVWSLIAVGCLVGALAPAPANAQVCEPLDNGHLADAFYEGTVIFWEPVVEYRELTLTINGPCETITHVFKPGEEVSFDLAEITKMTDGSYTWELRRAATVDPSVEEALREARDTGQEQEVWWGLFQKGAIPAGPYVDSAPFLVERGLIVDPGAIEGKRAVAPKGDSLGPASVSLAAAGDEGGNPLATKGTVLTNADGIIRNSLCVGSDCSSSESFGFDTVRLKENNTRLQFNDTSSISGFPTRNWQIRANDSASGGASYLGFVDQGNSSTGESGTLVFAVEGGAGANALRVDNGGRVGLGTGNPVVELHVVDGDTPTLRLDQDGSSGFASQRWDVAGNETSFFIRDATNGSTLPFRIRPGAGSNALVIDTDDDVGIGTLSPTAPLHVLRNDGSANLRVEEGSATEAERTLLNLVNKGNSAFQVEDTSGDGSSWQFKVSGPSFRVNKNGTGGDEIVIRDRNDGTGNATLVVNGSVQATNVTFSSSRSLKQGFVPVDVEDVLTKVTALPLTVWQFKADSNGRRHLGPIAEDFHEAFGLGTSPAEISAIDASGVALAAIQGLQREVEERDARIRALEERLARLEALLDPR